jgi:DNA repair exonuclease SbcCD ATPase subunit
VDEKALLKSYPHEVEEELQEIVDLLVYTASDANVRKEMEDDWTIAKRLHELTGKKDEKIKALAEEKEALMGEKELLLGEKELLLEEKEALAEEKEALLEMTKSQEEALLQQERELEELRRELAKFKNAN